MVCTHGGTRTPNLRFRRPTPYPLGHAGIDTISVQLGFSYHAKHTARLAQSVEHETLNLRVVGSSPTLGEHCFTFLAWRMHLNKNSYVFLQVSFLVFALQNWITGVSLQETGNSKAVRYCKRTKVSKYVSVLRKNYYKMKYMKKYYIRTQNISEIRLVLKLLFNH